MSKFNPYWKALIRARVTESSHGAHGRRHTAGDYEFTNRISHASLMSTNHPIKITIKIIENDRLNQGVDFKVPSKSWLILQFMSNNGQRQTDKQYTGKLLFFRDLQTRELHNSHTNGHCNKNMKQLWRCNMDNLHDLVEEAINITISKTGVDYNNDVTTKMMTQCPHYQFLSLQSLSVHLQTQLTSLALIIGGGIIQQSLLFRAIFSYFLMQQLGTT